MKGPLVWREGELIDLNSAGVRSWFVPRPGQRPIVFLDPAGEWRPHLEKSGDLWRWVSYVDDPKLFGKVLRGLHKRRIFITFWGANAEGKSTIPHILMKLGVPIESEDRKYTQLPSLGVEFLGTYSSQCGGVDRIPQGKYWDALQERWFSPVPVLIGEGQTWQYRKWFTVVEDLQRQMWRHVFAFSFNLTLDEFSSGCIRGLGNVGRTTLKGEKGLKLSITMPGGWSSTWWRVTLG